MYKLFVKPIIDFLSAIIIIIVCSPLLLLVTIILLFVNEGKPFFVQKRAGKNGRVFSLLKFRSMRDVKGENGALLCDNQRLTKIGQFFRRTSLDELPQLINVIKGDMSLVGPRPLFPEYLDLYNSFQRQRHEVKPGITGWAQVNGRNLISWTERFELDVWYVKNISFVLDCKVLLKTTIKVFTKEGVDSSEKVNMPLFKGNNLSDK